MKTPCAWISWTVAILSLISCRALLAAEPLPPIRVAADGRGFVRGEPQRPFVPWGFNYDHDDRGRLIEDYWDAEWETVAADFREMRELGANVVRIHLQTGKFLEAADRPNAKALERLQRLIRLAEETGLVLDLTGLGCYHKADVPKWYDALNETDRWQAQGVFWEAIARTAKESPAVFCYDLMNEPVVAAGGPKDDWLGPAFAGKHFVQYINRDSGKRKRGDIAVAWIHQLTAAIRKHDRRTLVTVGLVDWSLDDRPLNSGFDPSRVGKEVDFMSVHIYPEKGRVADALTTLKRFHVGKPVVIEETFPLKCDRKEFAAFIAGSRKEAAGWIGFYWGKTTAEYAKGKTIGDALMRQWLEDFPKLAPNE